MAVAVAVGGGWPTISPPHPHYHISIIFRDITSHHITSHHITFTTSPSIYHVYTMPSPSLATHVGAMFVGFSMLADMPTKLYTLFVVPIVARLFGDAAGKKEAEAERLAEIACKVGRAPVPPPAANTNTNTNNTSFTSNKKKNSSSSSSSNNNNNNNNNNTNNNTTTTTNNNNNNNNTTSSGRGDPEGVLDTAYGQRGGTR